MTELNPAGAVVPGDGGHPGPAEIADRPAPTEGAGLSASKKNFRRAGRKGN